jgi:hypothetical protein
MATSTQNIKKAEELLAQCKVSEGGCSAIKMKVADGKKKGEVVFKEVWQQSIAEFPHLPHQLCFGCKAKNKPV